ncbi:DUF4429 domain-containing protein [Nonomuraea sp. KC401]|uniref:DUF4429 domain-containing protein n=1 Tax=unclassified Nonomuraea TaxID=2593643 RepID=UPI0010FF2B64|nr:MULTISPECIES: DUF4429 domain-containing protein [unclassified Nonomuraea]NBE97605.1 DUF4429 domain-containing protein [Nonomuraea sp. K271]TLF72522.1 DUF4429 domain-containing protein [Nonomuraea sp. KC401]
MAEIAVPDGLWTFNGEVLRIVPGSDKDVHELRRTLGEVVVPLAAIAGVTYEPGRKGGHVRLRLRKGADALSDVVAGLLVPPADPYRLAVPKNRAGAGEYFADEVRDTLLVYQTPSGPCEDYLLPPPPVPISATAGDGTALFDGDRVRLEWTGFASTDKEKAGSQEFPLSDIAGVEWKPQSGMGYGTLRFRIKGERPVQQSPQKDTRCVAWGIQRFGGATALVAAAVLARLPRDVPELPPAPASVADDVHDAVLRRLAELGDLHRAGVLTDDEFGTAKQAVIRRLQES